MTVVTQLDTPSVSQGLIPASQAGSWLFRSLECELSRLL